jgi:hypothetical protein
MIWAVLALLGIPLWLCAVGILDLVFRDRGRRRLSSCLACCSLRWLRSAWASCWAPRGR